MPRIAIEIILTTAQKARLEKVTRSHSGEHRLVERAGIILACATGKQNQEAALDRGHRLHVSAIGADAALHGFAGLEDELRPGKPETYGQAFRDKLLSKRDAGLARWDCQTLAEDLSVSKHAVWRALKKGIVKLV